MKEDSILKGKGKWSKSWLNQRYIIKLEDIIKEILLIKT